MLLVASVCQGDSHTHLGSHSWISVIHMVRQTKVSMYLGVAEREADKVNALAAVFPDLYSIIKLISVKPIDAFRKTSGLFSVTFIHYVDILYLLLQFLFIISVYLHINPQILIDILKYLHIQEIIFSYPCQMTHIPLYLQSLT